MTQDEAVALYRVLPDAERKEMTHLLDERLRQEIIEMRRTVDEYRKVILGVRPLTPADRRGWLQCVFCLAEHKKKEFKHAGRCPWAQVQEWLRRQQAEASLQTGM